GGQSELGAVGPGVALEPGGQPVGVVLLGVVLGSDAEEATVEQADGAGEHAVAAEALAGERLGGPFPQRGQDAGEVQHAVELLGVAPGSPALVVEVLPAAGRGGAAPLRG